jgi:hypothetical protein
MIERQLMRLFVAVAVFVNIAAVTYVYVWPPASTRVSRNGVPHFTPPVVLPATAESIPVEQLVHHFRGGRQ